VGAEAPFNELPLGRSSRDFEVSGLGIPFPALAERFERLEEVVQIAGSGERKTLRLVARYADMCNLFDLPGTGFADDLKHKLEVLRSHCEDAGRDYTTIEKTVSTFFDPGGDRAGFLAHLVELAELGIDHVMLGPRRPWDEPMLDQVGAVVADVHAIASAR
jgi:alkanesulfonate monooxygenase SsuD/methylene tetrahydromethanopterin reductase-like flavin-dependent oxidoreductase (luciferase family)